MRHILLPLIILGALGAIVIGQVATGAHSLISGLSTIVFGAPRFATRIIARPISSVVKT